MSLRAPIVIGLAVIATLTFAGCSGKAASSAIRHLHPSATSESETMDADYIGAGFTAIDTKVGAPHYGVIQVSINPSSLIMQVVDPNQPANVDEYVYRRGTATVDNPAPVDLTGSDPGALEQNTFQRTDLDPQVIAKVIGSAPEQSGIDQAAATAVIITYPLVARPDDQPYIQVDVKGPRGHANPRYNLQGDKLDQ
ncbi:hypothetical protein [Mycobacterium talmoniae]|uniref:Uncharacterized protein n=1 Tax=Mycobacterium talmoniae TaxID=1858794 RepID=A0A1S1NI34_9MYCO|nr:hypothetical protein [Mycobacterium talmoniae]OHV00343.1 hypothetical protein BKN37_18190 [Mycobacterium talmoniae]